MPATAQAGLQLSYRFSDPALTRIWLDRYDSEPVLRDLRFDVETARRIAEVPTLRTVAEEWIVEQLQARSDWLGPDRPLNETRSNFETERAESLGRLNLLLGRLRLAREDDLGAIVAMERAVDLTWSPEVFAEVARLHQDAGSAVRASALLARARMDPLIPLAPYLPVAESDMLPPTETDLAMAGVAWREHVLAALLDEPINWTARLRTPSGEETTLGEATGNGLTLIIQSLSRHLVPAESLELIEANADGLAATGTEIFFITVGVGPATAVESASLVLTNASYHDDERFEVWEALGAWREVQYFVVGTRGTLRYRGEDLATALRVALVLGDPRTPLR